MTAYENLEKWAKPEKPPFNLNRQLDGEKKPQLSWAQRRRGLLDRVARLESMLKDLRGEIAKGRSGKSLSMRNVKVAARNGDE